MSKHYKYPEHIRSRLLDELLVFYKLRDGKSQRPTATHIKYLNRLRDYYAVELDNVQQIRRAAFSVLKDFADTADVSGASVSEQEVLAYVAEQVGAASVLTLALSDVQCVLIFAAQERDRLRAEQDGTAVPEPVLPDTETGDAAQ